MPDAVGFTTWTLWSECSVTCSFGTIYRKRECTDPSLETCVGILKGNKTCYPGACPGKILLVIFPLVVFALRTFLKPGSHIIVMIVRPSCDYRMTIVRLSYNYRRTIAGLSYHYRTTTIVREFSIIVYPDSL